MMKKIAPVLLVSLLLLSLPLKAEVKIKEFEFANAQLLDVIRTLSELSESNIIATPAATEKMVTIHLKNVSVLDAIKSISRISDLWYRYDEDTNTYRIMTREEYSKDLIIRDSEHIEVFRLLNANVRIVAQSIEDLYGERVTLSLGIEAGNQSSGASNSSNSSSRNGVRNSRSFNQNDRNNRSNDNSRDSGVSSRSGNLITSGAQLNASQLSQSQIEQIAARQTGNQALDSETLQAVTVQSQPIYVTVNNEHNMIIVRTDDKKVIQAISQLVKEMDIPIPQVMLEMKILSVILGEDFNSIFNFQVRPGGSNQSTNPILLGNNGLLGTGSFIYEFLNNRLQANIEFLEQNNRVKVLSNPMVLASNHREAELFIGEESLLTRGFTFTGAVISDGTIVSPGFIEATTELEEIGITLRITPRINSDKTVTLDLQQENSTINVGGSSLPISDGAGNIVTLPVDTVNTARLTGTVLAQDGLTVAVGGLIRTSKSRNEQKVPLLGEIPVIGRVFRSTTETEEETETVLLITPHIIERPEQSESIREADNMFYKSHNAGDPDPVLPGNKFIQGPGSAQPKSFINPASRLPSKALDYSPSQKANSRQQLYLEMSQYAAEMMRVPEIERVRDDIYEPERVQKEPATLFQNKQLHAEPMASWRRGGMYVTALQIKNNASAEVMLDYQNIRGIWLASSVEKEVLAKSGQRDSSTYLYVISALPFAEAAASVR